MSNREAYTNSTMDDMESFCFCNFVREVQPKPLHPKNIYQQFEIHRKGRFNQLGGFVAKSVSQDGFPPKFLARKGWEVCTSTPKDFHLGEAPGLDTALRSRLPEFGFPLARNAGSSPVVVGKWYCPFMFIKEGTPKEQMRKSMFYQMTLEQRWEQIYYCDTDISDVNDLPNCVVNVDVCVEREVVMANGRKLGLGEREDINGVVWFKGVFGKVGEEIICVGLCLEIVERMEWEEKNFGWVRGKEREIRVKKEEKINVGLLRKFGCYVLVERFVLRRMDGSLVLTYDFKHTHQIRSKWE